MLIFLTKFIILSGSMFAVTQSKIKMRNGDKVLIGITSVLAIGLAIYLVGKIKKDRMWERLERIAEEGYETAADILYPLKDSWTKKYRTDYSGR